MSHFRRPSSTKIFKNLCLNRLKTVFFANSMSEIRRPSWQKKLFWTDLNKDFSKSLCNSGVGSATWSYTSFFKNFLPTRALRVRHRVFTLAARGPTLAWIFITKRPGAQLWHGPPQEAQLWHEILKIFV